ncbi:hypothetical protein DER44DRAFT_409154 [Fusarium oxysporum]|nr:hypothetical protein DER44DRAFT_409154 [Fusarium oxysporum]
MFTHIMVIHLCLSLCFCYPVIASILFPLIISNPSVNHCSQIKPLTYRSAVRKPCHVVVKNSSKSPCMQICPFPASFSPLCFFGICQHLSIPYFFRFLGCSVVCLLSPSSCRCFSLPPLQSKAAFFFFLR